MGASSRQWQVEVRKGFFSSPLSPHHQFNYILAVIWSTVAMIVAALRPLELRERCQCLPPRNRKREKKRAEPLMRRINDDTLDDKDDCKLMKDQMAWEKECGCEMYVGGGERGRTCVGERVNVCAFQLSHHQFTSVVFTGWVYIFIYIYTYI